ncbi:MAG TPA: AsmA-like C-terminal region-containing protein [Candidatus Sulfotelmatobacter sp.]|nr:AsmA-like C-terminal region-containing protein [Candidatus Sulfotelmatobacter sp.]
MSSPSTARSSAARPQLRVIHGNPSRFTLGKKIALAVAAVVVVGLLIVLYSRIWPYSRESVLEDLKEASDSTVTIQSFHKTYFPPGCVMYGLEFQHGTDHFKLLTIEKLIIEGSYIGILRRHVSRITAVGAKVFIPPFGSGTRFNTQHSKTVVDTIVANGSFVEFASSDPHKKPLRFDVHEALLSDVRWAGAIAYRLKFHNPDPSGELSITGKFGPWTRGRPGDTPFSGEYTFADADLGHYGGIAGILSSKGRFEGRLQHVNISGTTDIPDFEVTHSGHKVRLDTKFDAYVDATHGDTFLKRVEAHFGRTTVIAEGSIAKSDAHKGKFTDLHLSAPNGRIEDILGLFVSEPRSPMSGETSMQAHAEIPARNLPFLEKIRLQGSFGVEAGSFSKPKTQENVNELSAGARGESKEDPETVLTDLKGQADLAGGTARFSNLSFRIPGARARMYGTYNIINHKIDLHGKMRVETRISKTSSGFKALLLKIMDPIFKKKKKGEIVPVHIGGTYEKPEFGLDLNPPDKKSPAH